MITTGFFKRTLIGTNTSTVGSWSFDDSLTSLQGVLDEWTNSPQTQWLYEEITRDEYEARVDEKYPFDVENIDGILTFVVKERCK